MPEEDNQPTLYTRVLSSYHCNYEALVNIHLFYQTAVFLP